MDDRVGSVEEGANGVHVAQIGFGEGRALSVRRFDDVGQ